MEININQLQKKFGKKTAVDIEQYHIHSGELVGLVGNNGAGKTTLFRLMLDLLKADNGCIYLGEQNVSQSEEWKNSTGAFIDSSFLIDYLTPEEYFDFVGKMYGIASSEITHRLESYHDFFNDEILGQNKLIRHLSAGNQQKIGILSALLHEPQIVILDEPFNFLDPTSQMMLKQLLKNYNQRTQATIIVSSHNLSQTIDLCPRIALMENGKIIQDLTNTDGQAKPVLEHYFKDPYHA